MTTQEFDQHLNKFLENGDEAGARAFIIEKYVELPADRQERLAWAFLDEAAAYAEREADALSNLQTEAMASLEN